MNRTFAMSNGMPALRSTAVALSKRAVVIGAIALAASVAALAQNGALQEKLAAVKQAAAENKQQLRQYQWTETTQLTLKGDPKPVTENLCQYGPDGQVQKTPIGRSATTAERRQNEAKSR